MGKMGGKRGGKMAPPFGGGKGMKALQKADAVLDKAVGPQDMDRSKKPPFPLKPRAKGK